MPEKSLSESLMEAARRYSQQMPGSPAEKFLVETRGLDLEKISRFGLGFSGVPEPGHEKSQGRLVIPYLRQNTKGDYTVLDIRFRRLGDSGAKYLGLPGSKPRLFNTRDAILNDAEIAICEGEMDALTASAYGIPAVGVPGANVWRPHWTGLFSGFTRVWILADGDPPGLQFAETVSGLLGGGPKGIRIASMPDGEDVSSMFLKGGIELVKERMR